LTEIYLSFTWINYNYICGENIMEKVFDSYVKISAPVHEKIKEYCRERGLLISFQVDKIVDDFLTKVESGIDKQHENEPL
jgi:hypothetical protein